MTSASELPWEEFSKRPKHKLLARNVIKLCSDIWLRHEQLFNDTVAFLNTSQADEDLRDRTLDRLHRVFNGIKFFAYKEGDPQNGLLTLNEFLQKTHLKYDSKLNLTCGTIGYNYDLLTEIKANADVLVMSVGTLAKKHTKSALAGQQLVADMGAFWEGDIQDLLEFGLAYQELTAKTLSSKKR